MGNFFLEKTMHRFIVGCLTTFALGAMVGWSWTSDRYQSKMAEITSAGVQTEMENIQKQRDTEQELYFTTQQHEAQLNEQVDAINHNFELLLDGWMHSDGDSSGETALSENATDTATVSDCQCRCDVKNSAKFQKLYERQMMVARDCDITAAHYNELIRLVSEWNSRLNTEN
jgi:hypothetical protein